jgi:pilus assembly protein Flp/PilA
MLSCRVPGFKFFAAFSNWRTLMLSTLKKIRTFLRSEDGPTAVEYAVMLALIVVVCLVAITSIGTQASATFSNVAASIGGAS